MKYFKYQHEEHCHGPGLLTQFFEVNKSNEITRSIEIRPDGGKSKYDQNHPDDNFGGLPEVEFDLELAQEFGEIVEISQDVFNHEWISRG